jgi:hypothetical protein
MGVAHVLIRVFLKYKSYVRWVTQRRERVTPARANRPALSCGGATSATGGWRVEPEGADCRRWRGGNGRMEGESESELNGRGRVEAGGRGRI